MKKSSRLPPMPLLPTKTEIAEAANQYGVDAVSIHLKLPSKQVRRIVEEKNRGAILADVVA